MPSIIISPQQPIVFPGRHEGYVIRVYKTLWKHVVRFIANDDRGSIIAEGTVPSDVPYREFLVHPDTGFTIVNVGTWDMDVVWPAVSRSDVGVDSELDQVISNLPWADGFDFGAGVDAITGGVAGRAVEPFVPDHAETDSVSESYRFIQDESDLSREIEASASGKYNIDGVTISASTSYLQKLEFSELSTTLIAEFRSQATRYDEATSYALTTEAKGKIADPVAFREAYGDYFVAGGKRASRFIATYRCTSKSVKSMDEFKASFGGDVPDVFSAEGSTRFMQSASTHNIDTYFDLHMDGARGTPPSGPWTPEKIMAALEWFKKNDSGVYLDAKLKHYSTIDPAFPRTVAIAPDVFTELRLLYARVWDIRARYGALPTYYQEQLQTPYRELDYGVQASQHLLATDASLRKKYRDAADALYREIDDIFARMDFYLKVKNAVSTEPAIDRRIDEGDGQQSWQYGFSVYDKSKAVVIHENRMTYREDHHVGWRQKTLEFGPDDKYLVVGWKVVSNWGDGTNGGWWKAVDQNLLESHGAVHVKSLYDRGCDWTVIYYYVDAKDYQF
jgi:hypothetical protein